MQFFSFILLLFGVDLNLNNVVLGAVTQTKTRSREPVAECTASNIEIDKTITQDLLKFTWPSSEEEDAIFQEELGCSWKSRKLLDVNGYLSVINFGNAYAQELRSQYPEELAVRKAEEAAAYCGQIKGSNYGESAVKILKCLGRWKNRSFINDEISQSQFKDVVIKTKKNQ